MQKELGTQDPIERALIWKKTRTSSKTGSLHSSSEEVSQRMASKYIGLTKLFNIT